MKKNIGIIDKIFRFLIAGVFAGLYFTDVVGGTAGIVLLILGGIFVLTALIGFCPLYSPFGINTCPCKTVQK